MIILSFLTAQRVKKSILNDGNVGYYIVVKTTSQNSHKSSNEGCQTQDRYPNFFLPQNSCCLKKDTWIGLDEFFEFTTAELLAKHFSGEVKTMGVLTESIVKALLECAINCDDILVKQIEVLTAQLLRLS